MNQSDKDLLGLSATANAAIATDPLSDGGQAQQALHSYLEQQMAKVPGFTPPDVSQENLCPLPNCSQEEINEFRSAGVLLKALAAEAKAWSVQLPPNYYPAIVAILHGGLQVQVRTLAQVSFDGIRIEGLLGESPCSILAHQNTVQLICHAILLDADQEEEPHPIGFIWPDHNEKIRRAPPVQEPTDKKSSIQEPAAPPSQDVSKDVPKR
ncbi:MAG: hypothetical protein LBF16_09210 [Pseudomonadales bacterium]|jgi:hypothetical protein|nr:hypothetical protein [Pseudomonadales bacterium]